MTGQMPNQIYKLGVRILVEEFKLVQKIQAVLWAVASSFLEDIFFGILTVYSM